MQTIQQWAELLAALAAVERDEAWLRDTTDPTVGGFSLAAARTLWEQQQVRLATEPDLAYRAQLRARATFGCFFYGPGGWHRYSVHTSGEVQFSAGHALAAATERAVAAGFGLYGR